MIYIHKGDSTIFANSKKFLTFNIETDLDLTGWTAEFMLGYIIKRITDISSHSFEVVLTAEETNKLRYGYWNGAIILTDAEGNTKTVVNTIPFEVTSKVIENEYQEIDLTIPESSGVDIKLKVGAETVTSVNGMTGDVVLEIPSIDGLATEQQLAQGLNTKQDKGDYALKEEIPSLDGYVKDTDYAQGSVGGVVKASNTFACGVVNGYLQTTQLPVGTRYDNLSQYAFIGKGTLENIKNDLVKRGITENDIELSAEEKANAKSWLGYVDNTDIMQAIASIPQFSLSIVNELPLAGEKMTLYLVPKEGTNNDVYDEYIWIEQTTSYEHLGTTAVDLTDYVKNTDYATDTVGGVVKINNNFFGLAFNGSNQLYVYKAPETDITNKNSHYRPIVPSNLDFAVKTSVTTNTIELTDDEKTSARTWLGAVGNTDYATASKAGILTPSSYYGTAMSGQYLYTSTKTLDQYKEGVNGMFVGKGTLENVLTQYSKTVSLTEADYEALETKDANTLYLIEE